MSRSWTKGSTRAWRKLRMQILERDRWICKLCHEPINPLITDPNDPRSAQVHHTMGKDAGDDPRYLAATHRECNQRAGDPTKHNPAPRPVTDWGRTRP